MRSTASRDRDSRDSRSSMSRDHDRNGDMGPPAVTRSDRSSVRRSQDRDVREVRRSQDRDSSDRDIKRRRDRGESDREKEKEKSPVLDRYGITPFTSLAVFDSFSWHTFLQMIIVCLGLRKKKS